MTSSGAQTESSHVPDEFRLAVDSLDRARVRSDIEVGPIRPPQRLAPFSYALGAEVKIPEDSSGIIETDSQGSAFGRLILLYDPEGQDAWNGTLRMVAYIQAEVEAVMGMDPMLPEVVWSWLTDALGVEKGATSSDGPLAITAIGGTVTSTNSIRYGDIAGPPRAHQMELRASWTPTTLDVSGHLEAFCEVLSLAAGLPPAGVTELGSS